MSNTQYMIKQALNKQFMVELFNGKGTVEIRLLGDIPSPGIMATELSFDLAKETTYCMVYDMLSNNKWYITPGISPYENNRHVVIPIPHGKVLDGTDPIYIKF